MISKGFEINIDTNKAIAYENVVITDPQSIMKAGLVEFDLKTKKRFFYCNFYRRYTTFAKRCYT